jgi:quinol monooxygenase YgiN
MAAGKEELSSRCQIKAGGRNMLAILVRYAIKPGKRAEFLKVIQEEGIHAQSKNEKGNVGYDYYYPVDSSEDILLIEKWSNREAWEAHKQASHTQKLQGIKEKYVLSMTPELLETKE